MSRKDQAGPRPSQTGSGFRGPSSRPGAPIPIGAGSLDRALQAPVDEVRDGAGAARASLFLRDPATGEAVTRVAHLPEVGEIRLPQGEGIVGAVFSSARAMAWPGDAPAPSRRATELTGFEPRSVVAFPVRLEGQVVGVLEVMDAPVDARTRTEIARAARVIESILASSALAAQLLPRLDRPTRLAYPFDAMVGACDEMLAAFHLARRAAALDIPVLVLGEKGVGKELLARTIHANSHRSTGPFVKAECDSLPDALLRTELVGYRREAFGSGQGLVQGRIQQAEGGTLFLEEVGSLPAGVREDLQRLLAEEVVVPVGDTRPQRANVRIIAASSRSLEEGGLSPAPPSRAASVFLLLGGLSIPLPALRDRGPEDLARLLSHFVDLHSNRHGRAIRTIPARTWEMLADRTWSGNLDELSERVEGAVLACTDGILGPQLFTAEGGSDTPFRDLPTLDALGETYIRYLMERFEGRRTEVARILGVGRTTLWRKLQVMGFADEEHD